eukprot:scaffold322832_cov14-Tisochrysis_lutea.AAC.1
MPWLLRISVPLLKVSMPSSSRVGTICFLQPTKRREPGEACTKNSVVRGANDPPGSASLICVHLPGKGGNSRLLPKPMRSFFLMMQGASSLP